MNKLKCSKCKKFHDPKDVIKYSYNKLYDKQYYYCNVCNTGRMKKYRQTEEGKEKVYTAIYKSIKKYQEKQNARELLNYHLRKGNIKKPKCCQCCKKNKPLQAHHHDYTKPLDIIWTCATCHSIKDNRKSWIYKTP